jgi:hypothetical protein
LAQDRSAMIRAIIPGLVVFGLACSAAALNRRKRYVQSN